MGVGYIAHADLSLAEEAFSSVMKTGCTDGQTGSSDTDLANDLKIAQMIFCLDLEKPPSDRLAKPNLFDKSFK